MCPELPIYMADIVLIDWKQKGHTQSSYFGEGASFALDSV